MAEISFMRMIFEVTRESIEEKESDIRKMVDNYKKGNAAKGGGTDSGISGMGGKVVGGDGGTSSEALTTSQNLELQFEMGQYSQMATGGSNIMKAIKDLGSAIVRNIG